MAIFEILPADLRARLEAIDPARESAPGLATVTAVLGSANDSSNYPDTVHPMPPAARMPRRQWALAVSVAAITVLVVGLAIVAWPRVGDRGAPAPVATGPNPVTRPNTLPATSPLTSCIDQHPTAYEPVQTDLANNFSNGRVASAFTLDGGDFSANPAPTDARPTIGAAQALCNLLASGTYVSAPLIDFRNVSFGLALVTVADSVLKPGVHVPQISTFRNLTLQSYHSRLAWIAVITTHSNVEDCLGRATHVKPSAPVPGYQVVAIDAETGANGIVYLATANAACGQPGYTKPSVEPAYESVSLPWTMVTRGPGPKSATISYPKRSCDVPNFGYFVETRQPVIMPDEAHPGLVTVQLVRSLTTCGPPRATSILLRSATLATDLPLHLTHAPVGALDVPQ